MEVEALTLPTPMEVMNQVDPTDTYFVVSDLASGYHQIRIPGSDSHLFRILWEDDGNASPDVYRFKNRFRWDQNVSRNEIIQFKCFCIG